MDVKTTPKYTHLRIIDDDKNTQLHYCAAQGKEEDFKKELVDKTKIDVENYLGWTPLMMACRNGHINMVKLLLELHADASKNNKFGYSILLIAVSSGKLNIITLILQHLLCGGISKNSMQSNLSPLSLAILFRHHEVFKFLVTQNFNLNAATPYTGLTPLMFATAMEDNSAYAILLKRHADITIRNFSGCTAHDIKRSKTDSRKSEKKPLSSTTDRSPLTPAELIARSPHMTPYQQPIPQIVFGPQGNFVHLPSNFIFPQPLRKSSDVMTPSPTFYIASPNVTPMTVLPQIFFPPEISPTPIYTTSPVPVPNDFLNVRMNDIQQSMFFSPHSFNYQSPCV